MTEESSSKDYTVCDHCRFKKIRCGREKPSCSNCIRQGQYCKWSGQGKKRNQTALLSHNVLGLDDRLQQVENSVLETQNSLERLLERHSAVLATSARPKSNSPGCIREQSASWSSSVGTGLAFTRPLGRFLTAHHNGLNEKYVSPASLDSVALDIKVSITEGLGSETSKLRERALLAQRKIDSLISPREEAPVKDGSPPSAPPFVILDAMIEPYFAMINPHFPVWTKENFKLMANALRLSDSPEQHLASIVCCNNLILMTLSATSLGSRRGKAVQIKHQRRTSSIDLSFITGFLRNAERALENVEQLVSPRLINVQALLSLCVVAQEFLPTGLSETALVLAVRCARSIGINQRQRPHGILSDNDVRQRQNISSCLYILDKAICWTVGSQPNIPMSNVHFDSSLTSSDDSATANVAVKAELAKIEELIYFELYANQVKPKTEDQVRRLAYEMSQQLQSWLADSNINVNEVLDQQETPIPKVELAVRFLCAQLLLIWPHRSHPDIIFRQGVEVARRAMRLLLRLWHSPSDSGYHAVFSLFLASCPPLYLSELGMHIIRNQGHSSDVDLFRDFAKMLDTITDPLEEMSYNKQLYQLSLIVIEYIDTKETQYKSRKLGLDTEGGITSPLPQFDRNSLYTPMSTVFSSANSSYSHIAPDFQSDQSLNLDYAMPLSPDNPYAFLSSITSMSGDWAQSSGNESVPSIGSYPTSLSETFDSLTQGVGSPR